MGDLCLEQPASVRGDVPVNRESFDLCADEYIATTAAGWHASPLKQDRVNPGILAKCWSVGPYMFSDYELGPYFFETTKAHVQNGGPVIVFEKILSGFEYGYVGGEDRYDRADVIQMHRQYPPSKLIATATRRQDVYIPKQTVGLDPNQAPPSRCIFSNSMMGKIVHAEWDSMFRMLARGDCKVSQHALDRFATSLKIALGVHPQREDVRVQAREILFRQIQRFIDANLDNPRLSSSMILAHHGVSRASLYRMFESIGGVRNYITDLRTSRALLEVWQSGGGYGAIRSAQDRWRFSSQPNFNRTVHRLFGNSPKRLLSTAARYDAAFRPKSDFAGDYLDDRWGAPLQDIPRAAA